MKKLTLKRQNHLNPNIDELNEMLADMNEFLKEEVAASDITWRQNLQTIIEFQDENGSFSLIDSPKVESDARVEFYYKPSYISSALLMKVYMTEKRLLGIDGRRILKKALDVCCGRSLRGHGYEAVMGQIEALQIFMSAGLRDFIRYYPNICPKFTRTINRISGEFSERVSSGNFHIGWGMDAEDEIRSIHEYFSNMLVFVYGTLMKGGSNYDNYLRDAKYLGIATIEDFDMYDLGAYPGIKHGFGKVSGELYEVECKKLSAIDSLEGEGSLYVRECAIVHNDENSTNFASIYVYNDSVEKTKLIGKWGARM